MSSAALVALLAAAAEAAAVVAGGNYRGALAGPQSKVGVSFRVSGDGRQVLAVRLTKLPIYCKGSPPPAARISFHSAAIVGGRFTAKGRDAIPVGPLKGTPVATLTMTGTFAPGGRESGTITTTFAGSASKCGGHSSYTTRS